MSTQPVDAETGLSEARAAFAAAVSGQAASGAPAPAPASTTPEPAPASSPAAAPAAEPAPAAPETPPAPATEPAPSLDVQDPQAKRFLEMHGGDPNKALAKALEYNNRLAELARAHPDLFKQGEVEPPPAAPSPAAPAPPAAPVAPPAAPAEPPVPTAPPVQVDPQQIAAEVDQRIFQDAIAQGLIREYSQNDEVYKARHTEVQQAARRLAYLEQKLADPDLAGDDIRKGDIRDEIRQQKMEQSIARSEMLTLQHVQQALDARFREHKAQLHEAVASRYQREYQEQAQAAELQATEQQAYTELVTAWPAAIARVAQAHQMPPDMLADFKAEAKLYAQARLGNDPDFELDPATLDQILAPVAKGLIDRLDRYHRQRSAAYAAQATQRAATPAPATPAPLAAGQAPAATEDPDAAMEQARLALARGLRR